MTLKSKIFLVAYAVMLVVIFTLPFYSADEYSIMENTTSQLGAKNTPNAWIMNATFILLGLASVLSGWEYLKKYWFQKVVLAIFGLSLLLTAFFSHAPIDDGIPFDSNENVLHSVFASITGWSFTLFAISMIFISSGKWMKASAATIAIMATLLSYLMFEIDSFTGIFQRLIFILCLGWMLLVFTTKSK